MIRGLLLGFSGSMGKFLPEPCCRCYESAGRGGAVAGGCSSEEGMYGIKGGVRLVSNGRLFPTPWSGGGLIVDS